VISCLLYKRDAVELRNLRDSPVQKCKWTRLRDSRIGTPLAGRQHPFGVRVLWYKVYSVCDSERRSRVKASARRTTEGAIEVRAREHAEAIPCTARYSGAAMTAMTAMPCLSVVTLSTNQRGVSVSEASRAGWAPVARPLLRPVGRAMALRIFP